MSGSNLRISKTSIKAIFSEASTAVEVKKSPKRLSPLSLRISEHERQQLIEMAGDRPLGRFIKDKLFGEGSHSEPQRGGISVQGRKLLAQILRTMGNSDIIRAIGNLHESHDAGLLLLSDEAEFAVRKACADIEDIRQDLIKALGLRTRVPS